ncbi:calpain-10 isoform X1 [Takifugu flavidus]|uniref:Calpain-10 n=1 Tax=Takifugu flavidus TaxID=433684 RepID=A0A5C6P3C5_9TELE|nr:calpain-10 isoform X1 [Takifugu flavidus]XP_056912580.1 calpain-10 isoform X1 [Takifugu flavidus]TWW73241.1 Calpain-10 [Takifugu flavidus]
MKEQVRVEWEGQALFEDPDFPSDDTSVLCDGSTPLGRLVGTLTWLRPQEICESPALFPGDINLAHPKQGLLGDCWFLCACSFLVRNKNLLNKVMPPDQPQWGDSRYRGSFQFCFWQQGHWKEVTIDDRLPCVKHSLCFSQCQSPTIFWVALLEKAYAKLHGSYEQLWAGQVSEALVDVTGGLAERWSLGDSGSELEQRPEQDSYQFRRRGLDLNRLSSLKDQCALSCSTHRDAGGQEELSCGCPLFCSHLKISLISLGAAELGQYHAMTVMEWQDVTTVTGSRVLLLRIRNPWGRCCWGGAWKQGGVGWESINHSSAVELQSRQADGEFWLDETEFMSQFDDVTVGYPSSDEGHLKSIYTGNLLTHRHQLVGWWTNGHSAGGSRNSSSYGSNPKFWLKVCDSGEVVVSLFQHRKCRNAEKPSQMPIEDRKKPKHQRYQAIALHMWQVEKKRFNLSRLLNKPPCASTQCHAYEREVILGGELEPGYYLVIPSTYQPGAEARFLIRVFSSCPTSLSALKLPAPSLPLPTDGEWETTYFQGSWVEGRTAGGSRNFLSHWQNPRFPITVCDKSTATSGTVVRINLHQRRPDTDLHPIGFHIYKVQSEKSVLRDQDVVASCVPHCYTQEVSLALRLPPGSYTIVPSTYQPGCAADFTLNVALRIHRKVVKSQERLGRTIQEISHISVMQSKTVAAPLTSVHLPVPPGV